MTAACRDQCPIAHAECERTGQPFGVTADGIIVRPGHARWDQATIQYYALACDNAPACGCCETAKQR